MKRKPLFNSWEDIWPIFRIRLAEKEYTPNENTFGRGDTNSYVKNTLFSLFKGLGNIWKIRRYKTWVFTSSSDLFQIDEQLVDNVTNSYVDEINDALLIVRPHTKVQAYTMWTQRYMYESFLLLAVMFLKSSFALLKKPILFESDLPQELKDIDYKSYYYRFLAEYIIFSKLIKWCKIERVMLNCSYVYFGYIYACKQNGVEVIEIQHGLISKEHKAYVYEKAPNKALFPDKILVYGQRNKEVLLKYSNIYSEKQIKVVGSNALYLYAQKEISEDAQISQLRQQYKKIVLFTGQFTVDKKSLALIEAIQQANSEFCFLFLARHDDEIEAYRQEFKQLIFYTGKQKFYDLVRQVDAHATVYSTTFIESLYFGLPNILFDIDNYPQQQYGELLAQGHDFILCTSNISDIQSFIERSESFDTQRISQSVNDYFNSSFKNNLKQAVHETI